MNYKKKPWIARRFLGLRREGSTSRVELTLAIDLIDFDDRAQDLLVYALAAFLRISPSDVRVLSVNPGSVKVVIELPLDAQVDLLKAHSQTNPDLTLYLKPFKLTGIVPLDDANSTELSVESISRFVQGIFKLSQDIGHRPTTEEVARRMRISVHDVLRMLRIARTMVAVEIPLGEAGIDWFGDSRDDREHQLVAKLLSGQTLEGSAQQMSRLSPREEMVLKMRFGVGDGSEHTLEEVGQSFAVTRERIREIESKALRKLRHPSRSHRLAKGKVDKAG